MAKREREEGYRTEVNSAINLPKYSNGIPSIRDMFSTVYSVPLSMLPSSPGDSSLGWCGVERAVW